MARDRLQFGGGVVRLRRGLDRASALAVGAIARVIARKTLIKGVTPPFHSTFSVSSFP